MQDQKTLPADLSILSFGAIPDGTTINTQAIQTALDTAHEQGGGRVVVPAGRFLTGSIILKDHVELHLSSGAVLLGSIDGADYPRRIINDKAFNGKGGPAEPLFGLVMAENADNIAVTGRGTICGNGGKGEDFRAYPLTEDGSEWHKPSRPKSIMFYYCTRVLVEGITSHAPQEWAQHYIGCDFLTIRGVRINAHANANGDGIDVDGCQDVHISDCNIDADDNALIFKGRGARDCVNITVQNCILASKITAIKTGTESAGGFKNIVITNCVIRSSYEEKHFDPHRQQRNGSGIALETTDGGDLDGIIISNIVMEECYAPFFIKLGDRCRLYKDGKNKPKPKPGVLRNVIIQNVICKKTSNRYSSTITGTPEHQIENITLENITIEHAGGIQAKDVIGEMPEVSNQHPWPGMFGRHQNYPAYGLYVRHVKNLKIRNLTTHLTDVDERPALYLDQVDKAILSDLDCAENGAEPAVTVRNSSRIRCDDSA